MAVSQNQVLNNLVGLIKYAVALLILLILAKYLPPLWRRTCYISADDKGMWQEIGKMTLKQRFNPAVWSEDQIKRGDIVVVNKEVQIEGELVYKGFPYRVIASPGDRILAKGGHFRINGKREKYPGIDLEAYPSLNFSEMVLPRAVFYILPDDRLTAVGGLPMATPAWQIAGKIK
jgi:signal peptidase I